jgi:carbon-monoxide dehydrogenase small subunit
VFDLNGEATSIQVEPYHTLNYVLREKLDLMGTKRGCETGGCGSCTVIVDGKAVYSCMMLAAKVNGSKVLTVEGLADKHAGDLDPVQRAFIEKGGLQCGYCTPGLIMSAKALLLANPRPSEAEIRDALVGNLCRCTGYTKVIEAVIQDSRVETSKGG